VPIPGYGRPLGQRVGYPLDQRNIGDFHRWKDHDAYKESFERVLRDLTIKP